MLSSRLLKVLFLGLALVAGGCDRQSGGKAQPDPFASGGEAKGVLDRSHKGGEIPDFTVSDAEGKQLRLRDLAGKPTLLNLWATWCAPCVAELPTLNALANRADLNLRVVTVSQDMAQLEKVQPFLDRRGLAQLPAWLDSDGDLGFHFQATLPMTVLFDAQGREVWRYTGGRDWSDAESTELLAEASGG